MSIQLAAGTERAILERPGHIALQVQLDSDLVEVAAEALELATMAIREELPTFEHAEVVRIPGGPFLRLEAGTHPKLSAITEIVALNLRSAGIEDAVIATLIPSPIGFLASMPGAVVCRLFHPSPETRDEKAQPVPSGWLSEAAAWLTEGLEDSHRLWAESRVIEFPLVAADAERLFELQRHDERCDVLAVAGNPRSDAATYRRQEPFAPAQPEYFPPFWHEQIGGRLRGAALRPYVPHLVIAGGGADATDEELVTIVERLRDICRRLAGEVGYAFIDICPTLGGFTYLTHPTEWATIKGERSDALQPICDEIVFDAFAYQVLGPGHRVRLGAMPPGAVPLEAGRFELAIDTPAAWFIDPLIAPNPDSPWSELAARRRDKTVAARARQVLEPCLVGADSAGSLADVRWDRVQHRRLGFDELHERDGR